MNIYLIEYRQTSKVGITRKKTTLITSLSFEDACERIKREEANCINFKSLNFKNEVIRI